MYSVVNCNYVAKYTEFYLKLWRFKVTFTDNAECFKQSFIIVLKMLPCSECYENVYT
jgi:hypothetical protein